MGATMQLHTYLNFNGNCEQAFKFYEQHLGGKILMLMRHGDQPGGGAPGMTGVLHARMTLAGAEISAADVPNAEPMRSAYLELTADSVDEAERLYALLAEGGQIFMKMEETFFASRFAMFRDRFGTSWMLLGPSKMPAPGKPPVTS
jgi:PhnB protein